jgi:large-conductance mechanosensitive channel
MAQPEPEIGGAIPYFYFYGFGNRWITAGLALWLVAGVISKIIKVPIYKTVAALQSCAVVRLREERQKLNTGNMLQAILNFVAGALMTIAFIR